jgi:hypothetical protein
VDRFFALTGRTPAARALVNLSNGEPLLIESSFGAGRVVLFTIPLDQRWSSLPLTNLYLPLVQSALRYVAGSDPQQYNPAPGASWSMTVATTRPVSGRAVVFRPDGSRDTAEVADLGGRSEVRYSNTRLAGVYTVRMGPRGGEQSARFAVAPSPLESDLTPLTSAQWRELSDQLGFERLPDAAAPAASVAAALSGSEWWLMLLLAAVLLMLVELAVTAHWSRRR